MMASSQAPPAPGTGFNAANDVRFRTEMRAALNGSLGLSTRRHEMRARDLRPSHAEAQPWNQTRRPVLWRVYLVSHQSSGLGGAGEGNANGKGVRWLLAVAAPGCRWLGSL